MGRGIDFVSVKEFDSESLISEIVFGRDAVSDGPRHFGPNRTFSPPTASTKLVFKRAFFQIVGIFGLQSINNRTCDKLATICCCKVLEVEVVTFSLWIAKNPARSRRIFPLP